MYSWSSDIFPSVEIAARVLASSEAGYGQEVWGGRGAELLPLEPTALVLAALEVEAHLVPVEESWRIAARYRVTNPTREPVVARVALAEESAPIGLDAAPTAGRFRDVVVAARLAILEPVAGASDGASDGDAGWGPAAGEVRVYELELAAGESVDVDVSYAFDASSGVDFTALRFLARSVGLWAAPAFPARYRITLARPPFYLAVSSAFALISWEDTLTDEGTRSVATFACPAWPGDDDVRVVMPGASLVASPPGTGEAAALCFGWAGDADDDALHDEVAAYSDALLAACGGHLAAMYGDPRFQGDMPEPPYPGLVVWRHPPNPELHAGWYTSGERRWLAAVTAERKRRDLEG